MGHVRKAEQIERRKRLYMIFEKEPDMTSTAIAERIGMAPQTVLIHRRKWRKEKEM